MLLSEGGRPKRPDLGRWRIVAFFCLSVLILSVSIRTDKLHVVESGLYQFIYQPVREVLHFPLRLTADTWQAIENYRDTGTQLASLAEENRILHAQTLRLGHLQAENRRLRMLMDSVLDVRVPVSVAELRDTSIDGYRELITIGRGSRDDVYLNQSVIDPYGLVGQVVAVFPSEARVMLISDARSRVPVYVERTQQRTLLSGSAEAGVLLLPEMSPESDIQQGDILITSGLGGVFPRGYPVAKVAEVIRDPRLAFIQVRLEPMAQLASMLEVLLLSPPEKSSSEQLLPNGPPEPWQKNEMDAFKVNHE